MSNEFLSVEIPDEYAGRVTQEEWDRMRERYIGRPKQAVRTMPDAEYRAARSAVLADADAASRAASTAAELRRIEARYARKG